MVSSSHNVRIVACISRFFAVSAAFEAFVFWSCHVYHTFNFSAFSQSRLSVRRCNLRQFWLSLVISSIMTFYGQGLEPIQPVCYLANSFNCYQQLQPVAFISEKLGNIIGGSSILCLSTVQLESARDTHFIAFIYWCCSVSYYIGTMSCVL